MRRLALVLTCCGLVMVMGASPALARGSYDHVWQIEGLYAGSAGDTRKVVQASSAALELREGGWAGTITLRDVLGIRGAAGITDSQQTSMTLTLEGDPQAGATSAAGYFTGVAEVRLRRVGSLAEAVKPSDKGTLVTYDVYGYWAAKVAGDSAKGNLLFQAVRPRGAAMPERTAMWFNRTSLTSIEGTAEPQAFSATKSGLAIAPGDDETTGTSGAGAPTKRTSVFARIWRGLTNRGSGRALPVPGSAGSLARALADAAPSDATSLPANSIAIDRDVAGATLDAKNRAAGLLEGVPGTVTIAAARDAGGNVDHGDASDSSAVGRSVLLTALRAAGGRIPGAVVLAADVASLPKVVDAQTATRIAQWSAAVRALTVGQGLADVYLPARAAAAKVSSASIRTRGPLADAVLAAADHPGAPADVLRVATFRRESASDLRSDAKLPASLSALRASIETSRTGVMVTRSGGEVVTSKHWLAYRRGDGALFWLPARDSGIAIASGGLRGWVWASPQLLVVDSARAGRAIEVVGKADRP